MQMDENLINEFENAYHEENFQKMADILRFIRSLIKRDSNLAKHLPFNELVNLLVTIDNEQVNEEACILLKVYIESVDFASLLSTYGGYLQEMLKSERKSVISMGIAFMEKALVPSYCEELNESLINLFFQLVTHEDTSIACQAVAVLSKSNIINDPNMQYKLNGLGKNDAIVQMRVLELLSKADSSDLFLSTLKDQLLCSDELVQMNVLTVIKEKITPDNHYFQKFLLDEIMDPIFIILDKEGTSPCLKMIILQVFTDLAKIPNDKVALTFETLRFKSMLRKWFLEDDVSNNMGAISILSYLAINPCINQGWISELVESTRFIEFILSNSDQLMLTSLNALLTIYSSSHNMERKQKLYAQFSEHKSCSLVDHLIDLIANTLEKPKKILLYNMLEALIREDWVIKDALDHTRLISFLLDREREKDIDGMYAKLQLVKTLLNGTTTLDDKLSSQLKEYLRIGAISRGRQPGSIVESRV